MQKWFKLFNTVLKPPEPSRPMIHNPSAIPLRCPCRCRSGWCRWDTCWPAAGLRRGGRRDGWKTDACCLWVPVDPISGWIDALCLLHLVVVWMLDPIALLYLSSTHVGMPGIELAFQTPDRDNRTRRKLLLLKRCLLDMGYLYDISASICYFVWETYSSPPRTLGIVVTELQEVVKQQTVWQCF